MEKSFQEKSGGIGAQSFQILVDIYQADTGWFRRVMLEEVIPISRQDSPLGRSALRLMAKLVEGKVIDQEQLDSLIAQAKS